MRFSALGFAAFLLVVAACTSDATTDSGSAATDPTPSAAGDAGSATSRAEAGTTPLAEGDAAVADAGADVVTTPPEIAFTTETVMVNGVARTYALGTPTTLVQGKTYPVVVLFHGNPGTVAAMMALQPFQTVSHGDAILVYPQAAYAEGDGTYSWDLFTKDTSQNADIQMVRALPAALTAKGLPIDATRIYGYGHSGGAFFLQSYQCLGTDVFRSITCNAGGTPFGGGNDCATCTGKIVPTLLIHGQADDVVGAGSGTAEASCQAKNAKCQTTTTATTPTPCVLYDGCPAASPIEFCFVPGAGHEPPWSDSLPTAWAFFKAH